MGTIAVCSILSILAALLIPTAPAKADRQAEDLVLFIAPAEQAGGDRQLRLLHEARVDTVSEKQYLTQVVLSEMPADFEPEALRAQAVAARTFLRKRQQTHRHDEADVCSDSACCQAWTEEEALREKFGENFDTVWSRAEQAVESTRDEVLYYGGELIDATYFSCSGGSTESALSVWGSEVPYLRSVPSPDEQDAARYESSASFTSEEFRAILEKSGKTLDFSEPPPAWIEQLTRTDGGGVDTLLICGAGFSGTELRSLFGLNSTLFTLQYEQERFCFSVRGYGHRVGMSQYGAQSMAKLGFSYRTILQYYYPGTKIKTAPEETGAAECTQIRTD